MISSSFSHPIKVEACISFKSFGRITFSKEEQKAKALFPISLTDSGILHCLNFEQPKKLLYPIDSTVEGKLTDKSPPKSSMSPSSLSIQKTLSIIPVSPWVFERSRFTFPLNSEFVIQLRILNKSEFLRVPVILKFNVCFSLESKATDSSSFTLHSRILFTFFNSDISIFLTL